MNRTKLAVLGLAVAGMVAGALAFAPSASAAQWHVYEGDVAAGHAYGLIVPAEAESYEVLLEGGDGAKASLALFDPEGAKLGHYALDASVPAAAIVSPAEGRHVLYVYDVANGALKVRVNSAEPPTLMLQKLPLLREDVEVGDSDGGAFAKTMTATLPAEPVFLTLLYEGSVQDLDATIASATGNAVTITDESGTAFSPGVWSALTGARSSDARNIGGTTYTLTVSAASFEGSMMLTTLAIDVRAPSRPGPIEPVPIVPPMPSHHHGHEEHAEATTVAPDPSLLTTFVLPEGRAIQFTALAGTLTLLDPEAHEGEDEERSHYEDYAGMAVSIYGPDDELVAFVEAYDHDLKIDVELPVGGDHVAFVHHASSGEVIARLAVPTLSQIREIALIEETYEFEVGGLLLGMHEPVEFELANVPVAMKLDVDRMLGAFTSVHVENELGTVASRSDFVDTPFGAAWGGTYIVPENFMAGEHRLWSDGALEGRVILTTLSYLRDVVVEPAPVEEAHAEAHAHHAHEEPEEPEAPESAEEEEARGEGEDGSFLPPLPF